MFIRKLVFLDIDGTILDSGGTVPPSTLIACRSARAHGHLLFISSGRPRSIIGGEIIAIGFDGVISSGGARIEIGNTSGEVPFCGKVILDELMPPETAEKVCLYLDKHGCGFSIERNDGMISNRHLLSYMKGQKSFFEGTPKAAVFDILIERIERDFPFEELGSGSYNGVNKIVFTECESLTYLDIQKEFGGGCEMFRGSVSYFGKESGEIGPKGVNKGSALKATAAYYGAKIEDTIAIGDSDNDQPMIKCAGAGIAMGNAEESLKALADFVTTSIKEDGILNAFKKYGIIESLPAQ